MVIGLRSIIRPGIRLEYVRVLNPLWTFVVINGAVSAVQKLDVGLKEAHFKLTSDKIIRSLEVHSFVTSNLRFCQLTSYRFHHLLLVHTSLVSSRASTVFYRRRLALVRQQSAHLPFINNRASGGSLSNLMNRIATPSNWNAALL